MDINTNIFRAYDIRGVAYEDLTEEIVSKLGKSLGTSSLNRGETLLIVARDGRNSSPDMYEWLSRGIRSTGCNVLNIGIVPTPLLYFSTFKLSSSSGVMITGSHNPSEYNGFKIVRNNKTISGEAIQEIKLSILENEFLTGKGSEKEEEIIEMYLHELKENVAISRPLKLAIDCGNGVASILAKEVYESLGCEVESIFSTLDGNFPNHHPDPSQPENLKDLIGVVLNKELEIGLAFDGDADRLGVVSSKGEIIYPDMQMILFSKDILANNQGSKIVFDVKCSKLLSNSISREGGIPIMSKTGHSFIKDTIAKESALLGGEMSGHIFFADDYYGYDDALYVGLRLLKILSNTNDTLSQLTNEIPKYYSTPEMRLEAESDEEKFKIAKKAVAYFQDAYDCSTVDGVRIRFGDGWGLVRSSNTQPVIVCRFEANSPERMKEIKDLVMGKLQEFGNLETGDI